MSEVGRDLPDEHLVTLSPAQAEARAWRIWGQMTPDAQREVLANAYNVGMGSSIGSMRWADFINDNVRPA